MLPLKAPGEDLLHASPSFQGLVAILGIPWLVAASLCAVVSVITWPFLLYVALCPLLFL